MCSTSVVEWMPNSNCSVLVSIILPVHNAESWLDACLQSVLKQTYSSCMELCVYNDASKDQSMNIINEYIPQFIQRSINVIVTQGEDGLSDPRGCGYAKNRAVASSSGEYLCFLDADDVMDPERIELQLHNALKLPKFTLIGSQVVRYPPDSTVRYAKWINNLTSLQLLTQIYTSNGPTIVMPTWFCHRSVFDSVGGFDEGGKGVPEDYIFFLKFLNMNGKLFRVNKPLMIYRHHPDATTSSVSEHTIWNIRLKELEKNVLSQWTTFTIWNAGKQGRKFYRDIGKENRKKVKCFCDVDVKKIRKQFYTYELEKSSTKTKVPIIHFSCAEKPFIICVKLDMTDGVFEANLESLSLAEGKDYVIFS